MNSWLFKPINQDNLIIRKRNLTSEQEKLVFCFPHSYTSPRKVDNATATADAQPEGSSAQSAEMTPPADDVPDRLANVVLDSATENSCCRPQDTTHQEPSSFESDPSNHVMSATLQPREAQKFHDTPLDRVLAAKEEPSNNLSPVAKLADQQPNAGGSGNLGEDFRQHLAACDSAGSALSLLLPTRRPSSDGDVELGYNSDDSDDSDDSDNPNPYWLEADVQSPEGWVERCVVSADTGSDGDFLFLSALGKIGPLDKVIFPIPPRKLKRYVNPFDPNKKITPLYYVNLRIRNRSVGLNHIFKLKLLDVPEGTSGYDIVLGHNAIDRLGDPNFLVKVKNANADGPRLAANHGGNNLFGALLKVKKSKSTYLCILTQKTSSIDILNLEKQLADKANDDKLRERDSATSTKLYATSSVDMQPSATPSWGETSQRSQGHSASFRNSATWHTSAQQPYALASRPNHGSLTAQQTALNHSPPVPDYRGDFASHRADTFSSQFTQNTQFSACSGGSTAASSISSRSTVPVDAGKRAGYAADYAVPQESPHSVDQQKQ